MEFIPNLVKESIFNGDRIDIGGLTVPFVMQKIKLKEHELIVGEPLLWAIYGASGELLLEKRHILSTEKQKETLLAIGLYREPTDEEKALFEAKAKHNSQFSLDSPFNVLDAISKNLKRVLSDMNNHVESDYNHRVFRLSSVVQKLCYENADAALGALLLDQNAAYTNIHPVLCAILTELMTRRLLVPKEDRQIYIAAALTQNIGMLELQNKLTNQTEKLSEQQRKAIKQHPFQSKEILQGLGVDHKEWLNTVLWHHERPDGQGYPSGLKGDALNIYAKILSLTDIYSAMVLPRKYRDGFFVKKALQDIFIQRGKSVDEESAMLLIKEIGVYPPGTFVKLANGDTAIVLRRGVKNASSPFVLCIINQRGEFYEKTKQRDTIHKDIYGIVEVLPRIENLKLNRDEIWGLA